MVKLDLFLISPSWESQYPTMICSGKYRVTSNHIPIYLDTIPPWWGPFPFKFYKSWHLLEGFDDLMRNSMMAFSSSTCPIDRISYKLKAIKKVIKDWIAQRGSNWSSRLQSIETLIQEIDIHVEFHPISSEVWQRKQEFRKEHFHILLEQETYWKQKFRIQWLKECNLNTTFFHKVVNARRRFNTISSLLINNM